MMTVDLVIPALNEESSIRGVLTRVPRSVVRRSVVVDNGSTDHTAEAARECGALVVFEPRPGYGSAMARGVGHLAADPPDIVLFMDGDGSDDPMEIPGMVAPILDQRLDLVIGARVPARREPGSMKPIQVMGTGLAAALLRTLYGSRATDLGPFRAIRWDALARLDMRDRAFGWTVEMQAKAARAGLRVDEVAVSCRRRTGQSKISGTFRGTVAAGRDILAAIFKYRRWTPRSGKS